MRGEQAGVLRGENWEKDVALHLGARDPSDGQGLPLLGGAQPGGEAPCVLPSGTMRLPLQGSTCDFHPRVFFAGERSSTAFVFGAVMSGGGAGEVYL